MSSKSRCSSGKDVEVYWRFCASTTSEDHIQQIVEELMCALNSDHRRWNQWSTEATRAKFEDRINTAAAGRLVPVDEVKDLRGGRSDLFEIRWQDIPVQEQHGDQATFLKTNARLIHAEPESLDGSMLGLVAHEKPQTDTAKAQQDEHIDKALNIYRNTEGSTWGIRPRGKST